jgi:hypothetical protein
MPTEHKPPVFDNTTKRPSKADVLARGAAMHRTAETGGQKAQPQVYGAAVSDDAAKIINDLMTKLPPAAVQFFIDHAIQANLIAQLRVILGADDTTDLLAWARGIMGIHEDEAFAWRQGMERIAKGAGPAIGYDGGAFENQRALTSSAMSDTKSGVHDAVIDVEDEKPAKISADDIATFVWDVIEDWDRDFGTVCSQGELRTLQHRFYHKLAKRWPEHFE